MLLESLANLAYEEVLTDNPEDYRGSEALFGLEEPSVTARARFSDGQEITIRLGDPVPGDREWYYMTVDGDDRLFAISRGQAEDLELELTLPMEGDCAALVDLVDEETCNPLACWHRMGEPADLTEEQLAFLKAAGQPAKKVLTPSSLTIIGWL